MFYLLGIVMEIVFTVFLLKHRDRAGGYLLGAFFIAGVITIKMDPEILPIFALLIVIIPILGLLLGWHLKQALHQCQEFLNMVAVQRLLLRRHNQRSKVMDRSLLLTTTLKLVYHLTINNQTPGGGQPLLQDNFMEEK